MCFRLLMSAWAAAMLLAGIGLIGWFAIESLWFKAWRARRRLPRAKARVRPPNEDRY
jgi:hypothetical protein